MCKRLTCYFRNPPHNWGCLCGGFGPLCLAQEFGRGFSVENLKLDKLTHQDLGQMQMYVNHYDRKVKLENENPTIIGR